MSTVQDAQLSLGQRLRTFIDGTGEGIAEFCRRTDIPYRSMQQYLNDERQPSAEALTKLAAQVSIDINWLLTGQGAASRLGVADGSARYGPEEAGERAWLGLYRALGEQDRMHVMGVAESRRRLAELELAVSRLTAEAGH